VPATTFAVTQTTTLGRIVRRAEQAPQPVMTRLLLDASCESDVVVLETSQETIYAPLACDRFWDDQAKQAFLNKQVAIVLEVTKQRFRVLLQTLDGAQAEFTVNGLWVR